MTTVSDQELTMTPLRGKSGKAFIGQYPNGEKSLSSLTRHQFYQLLLKSRLLRNYCGCDVQVMAIQ